MIRSLAIILAFCFISCSKYANHKNIEFTNSLESIKGWDPGTKIIQGEGHSGRFIAYADSSQIYNYGFHLPLKELSNVRIYHVNAKVWAKCTSLASNASLVISLQDGQSHLAYAGTKVENTAPNTEEWFAVKVSIDIPENAKPENELYVYVMNETKDRVYFDDMEIEVVTSL